MSTDKQEWTFAMGHEDDNGMHECDACGKTTVEYWFRMKNGTLRTDGLRDLLCRECAVDRHVPKKDAELLEAKRAHMKNPPDRRANQDFKQRVFDIYAALITSETALTTAKTMAMNRNNTPDRMIEELAMMAYNACWTMEEVFNAREKQMEETKRTEANGGLPKPE